MAPDVQTFSLEGVECFLARHGAAPATRLVVFPTGEDWAEQLPEIFAAAGPAARGVALAGFACADWNTQLTPWPAPPLFKKEPPFAGEAQKTLEWLRRHLLPATAGAAGLQAVPQSTAILGYSLAGLFALWALYAGGCFGACASCSGSLWYNGWQEYMAAQRVPAGSRVYLSLGSAEERARNPRMAAVGGATRAAAQLLQADPGVAQTTLQWHSGGHFSNPPGRLGQALAWLAAP